MFIKVLGKGDELVYLNTRYIGCIAPSRKEGSQYELDIVQLDGGTTIFVNDSKDGEIAKFLKTWRLEGK